MDALIDIGEVTKRYAAEGALALDQQRGDRAG